MQTNDTDAAGLYVAQRSSTVAWSTRSPISKRVDDVLTTYDLPTQVYRPSRCGRAGVHREPLRPGAVAARVGHADPARHEAGAVEHAGRLGRRREARPAVARHRRVTTLHDEVRHDAMERRARRRSDAAVSATIVATFHGATSGRQLDHDVAARGREVPDHALADHVGDVDLRRRGLGADRAARRRTRRAAFMQPALARASTG